MEGIIIKSTGSWYIVKLADGARLECRIKGKFRLDDKRITNPLAVGDFVAIENESDGKGIITHILPRKNYVVRSSPRKDFYLHLLAANVDQALLITTIVEPNVKPGFIDRYLLLTEPYNIPTHIVFNKADLYDEEDMILYKYYKNIYEKIGYKVSLTSTVENKGIEALKDFLKNKTTLVGGHSGVGKSSLINALQPTLDISTQEISDYSGKGQHTTTFAEMHELNFGGSIIDTPGIKSLFFINMEPLEVAHNFREFFELSEQCKFDNCMHQNEPKCAVKDALEKELISPIRYENYLAILQELNEQDYWKRNRELG